MSNMIRGLDRTPTIAALEEILNSGEQPKVNINPDGSISVGEHLGEIAKKVADLERDSQELGEIRATLWLNFGDVEVSDGEECRSRYGFVIGKDSTLKMLVNVLEKLIEQRGPLTSREDVE